MACRLPDGGSSALEQAMIAGVTPDGWDSVRSAAR